jgi:hypothetical protein
MDKTTKKEIYTLHQSARHWSVRKIFKKIAECFNCYGKEPHHTQISVTTLFLGIAEGKYDVVDMETGEGFWNEQGYNIKDDV